MQDIGAFAVERSLLRHRHGNGCTLSYGSGREEFLDGHRLLERFMRTFVGDAEAAFVQYPSYGILALMQTGAGGQAVKRRRRARQAGRTADLTGRVAARQRRVAGNADVIAMGNV